MPKKSDFPKLLLVTALYVLLAKLGLLFALKQSNITIFWPAGGFALVVLLMAGKAYLPAIFAGAYLAGLMVGDSHPVSLAIAAGNTLESGLAWLLLSRFAQFCRRLARTEDFFVLVACAMLAALASASIGPLSLWAADIISTSALPSMMQRWWMADVLGMVFLTSGILVWCHHKGWWQEAGTSETALLFLFTALVGMVVFCDSCLLTSHCEAMVTPIWIMPFVFWAALRTHIKVASLLFLLIFTLALWGAHLGIGYFGRILALNNYSEFWVSAMVVAIGGMALAINTAERKHLLQQMELTQFATDHASVEIYWLTEDSRIHYVNHQACQSLGYSRPELLLLSVLDIDPVFNAEAWVTHWQQIKRVKTLSIETLHRRQDGKMFPVEVVANYVAFAGREYNVAFVHDISRRKQSEAALQTSEQRFRDLFNHSPDPCWLIDDNRFVACNQAAALVLGYDNPETLLAVYPTQLSPALQADGRCSQEKADAMMAIAWRQGMHRFEWLHQHRDGHSFPVEVTLSKVCIGQKDMLYCVWRDISQQKQAEAVLRDLNSELDRRVHHALTENRQKDLMLQQQSHMVAMGEMIGNIAHQWRQPLNSLAIILMDLDDSFLSGEANAASISQSIQRCNELLAKMSSTIDDFHNFFKKDKILVKAAVTGVVEESVSLLETALSFHHICIAINNPQRPVAALFYPGELSQALLCLFNNAKDQIVRNHIRNGEIVVEIDEIPQWVVIRVSDNGGGINEQDLPKIFDPYFTTKADGSGLGLYISKLTIEQSMHGQVSAENTANGARFTILGC